MKKLAVLTALCMGLALFTGVAHCQAQGVNVPSNSLVYPLIDNIFHRTIVDITNLGDADVWLQCYITSHPAGDPTDLEKRNFQIKLTASQPFWWNTSRSFNGYGFSIPSFANRQGFLFCKGGKRLKGDAVVYNYGNGRAFSYNAAPGQAPSTIYFEGFADGFSGVAGTLVLVSLQEGKLSVGLQCWNENENGYSNSLELVQFQQYDYGADLRLSIDNVFTPKFHCAVTSTRPLWSITYQWIGRLAWGTNVFQGPASAVTTAVVVPPVPAGD